MMGNLSQIAAMVTMTAASLVMLYSFVFLVRTRHRGDLERLFAKAVIDARSRRSVIRGTAIVSAAFLATGVADALMNAGFLPDGTGDLVVSSLFAVGALCLLVQIDNGLRISRLTLQDEMDLRDYEPELFERVAEASPHGSPVSGMTLAYPVEDAAWIATASREGPRAVFPRGSTGDAPRFWR